MREYIESGIFLLPCPFCAAKEIKFSQLENDACQSWLEVGCEQCGAIFNESEMMPNEKTAFVLERLAKKWNTRNARELVQRYSRDTVVTALRGFAAQNNLNIQIAYTDDAVSHDDYKESPIFGRTRAANETEQGAIAALVSENGLSVFQTLNKALNARGYCLSIATVAARMPS